MEIRRKKNKKTVYIDESEDRLIRIAQKKVEEGDFFGAMRMLNRCHSFYDLSPDSCAFLADAYEGVEAHTQALRAWYGFLCVCDDRNEEDLADAYEGLAVNYMNLGREPQAAYYYNQLIRVDHDLTEESKMEIVELFSRTRSNPIRTVWPPEKTDYSADLNEGLDQLKSGEPAKAREAFSRIAEGSKQYRASQNLIAVSYLLEEKPEEAEKICADLIADDEEDLHAYTTYAAILTQAGREKEAKEIAQKLCRLETTDVEELYKIATVCCENGMHAEAYEKFCILESTVSADKNLMYFKAVSAYKCGKIDQSIAEFQKLLTVYPDASVARFYYDIVRLWLEKKEKDADAVPPELTYFYRIPEKARDNYVELLTFLLKLTEKEVDTVVDNEQVQTVLQWCFDEADGDDIDLQYLALRVSVHCRYDKFTQDVFLNPIVPDYLKVRALECLAMKNEKDAYGLVLCHVFRRIGFEHISVGVRKRKKFLEAYAEVYARFAMLSESHARRIREAAEFLYRCLEKEGKTEVINRTQDVACVIYLLTGLKDTSSNPLAIYDLFSTSEKDVDDIMEIVHRYSDRTGGFVNDASVHNRE